MSGPDCADLAGALPTVSVTTNGGDRDRVVSPAASPASKGSTAAKSPSPSASKAKGLVANSSQDATAATDTSSKNNSSKVQQNNRKNKSKNNSSTSFGWEEGYSGSADGNGGGGWCAPPHSFNSRSATQALHLSVDDNPNLLVYAKMELIIQRMQNEQTGVPVRTVKTFLSKIPSVFTGQDLIGWMVKNIVDPNNVESNASSSMEALRLANHMAAVCYFFPIDDHNLTVKNDNTYYRFQTPYYWPSKNWAPENTEYAVYLCKRTMQRKTRMDLADYEAESLAKLQKMFSPKWDNIFHQAEAQSKVDKKRDKLERMILDSQERAFWDVYKPPPGGAGCGVSITDIDVKKVCRIDSRRVDNRELAVRKRLQGMAANLKSRVDKCTIRVSKCAETYVEFFNLHREYDPFLVACEPSNPWIADSTDFWDTSASAASGGVGGGPAAFNRGMPAGPGGGSADSGQVAERRVRRWAFSCWDLLKDPVGHSHFRAFLEKEYATENLLFVEAVWKMKKMAQTDVERECGRIWTHFLGPGAEMLVNIDSKTHKITEENMKSPDRWTFDDAAAHLYYLMTSDSYSRYLRSSHYKDFLEGAKKKNTRSFAMPKLSTTRLNIVSSSASANAT